MDKILEAAKILGAEVSHDSHGSHDDHAAHGDHASHDEGHGHHHYQFSEYFETTVEWINIFAGAIVVFAIFIASVNLLIMMMNVLFGNLAYFICI